MDDKATLDDLKKSVKDFCEERNWTQFHNAKDLVIGISTEANELLQIFRFKPDSEIKELFNTDRRFEIEDELSDVLYFVVRFAQLNDIDLSEALQRKINGNAKKYPISKAKGSNKKYNEYN